MDGWVIGLLAGGAVLVVMVVLLGVVVKAAARTAATAQEVLIALEELKATMAPPADLASPDLPKGTTGTPSAGLESRARRAGDGAGG